MMESITMPGEESERNHPVHPLQKRMKQVGSLVSRSQQVLDEKTIHDLRVALRRCRSFAEGVQHIDPHRSWKQMLKQSKNLAREVGSLRDIHVMQIWVARLRRNKDPLAETIAAILAADEKKHSRKAQQALSHFDLKDWEFWSCILPERSASLDFPENPFVLLVRKAFEEFINHHTIALQTTEQSQWHEVRIALKRFRYISEDFFPECVQSIKASLSQVQDLLGEIHDLDMLELRIKELASLFEPETRAGWAVMIHADREARRGIYLNIMTGTKALWKTWKNVVVKPTRPSRKPALPQDQPVSTDSEPSRL